jgi:RNA polymerase sigma-70 factor (ECF subfamily)
LTLPLGTTRDAIDGWLAEQRPSLIRTAYSILRDRNEAEDVVQHTMLAVWQRARREQIRSPGGYLARAVYWNALKRRARMRTEVSLAAVPDPGVTSGSVADDRLDAFELEAAIAQLPATQQTVIRLRFYLGLSFREIGGYLAISTNTAASRTRYALANLRKLLDPRKPTTDKEARNE